MDDTGKPPVQTAQTNGDVPPRDRTRIRYLTPDMCQIHLGIHKALHVTVEGERTYGGVYAAYVFPVEYQEQYISLLQSTGEGDDVEVGIIRDLQEFPDDQARLVRQALARRHFIHTITRIHSIGWQHGMVAFDVETDKGHVNFLLRWKNDQAVEYGRHGKVLIDVDENRYVIADIGALTPSERSAFTRIIYW